MIRGTKIISKLLSSGSILAGAAALIGLFLLLSKSSSKAKPLKRPSTPEHIAPEHLAADSELEDTLSEIEEAFTRKALCFNIYNNLFVDELEDDAFDEIVSRYEEVNTIPFIDWKSYFEDFSDRFQAVEKAVAGRLETCGYAENWEKSSLDRLELYLLDKTEKEARDILYGFQQQTQDVAQE